MLDLKSMQDVDFFINSSIYECTAFSCYTRPINIERHLFLDFIYRQVFYFFQESLIDIHTQTLSTIIIRADRERAAPVFALNSAEM